MHTRLDSFAAAATDDSFAAGATDDSFATGPKEWVVVAAVVGSASRAVAGGSTTEGQATRSPRP